VEVTACFRSAALLSLLWNSTSAQLRQSTPESPGELVDVGGYRVHLHCTGQGTPTVMIVGAGFSFDWDLVQSQAAQLTRVCTYDPAGTAWSDPGPGPECSDRVSEIHRLLPRAGIPGPYVLVGLSIGALVARLYAARFPGEVAGIVLADHPYLESGAESIPAATPQSNFDTPPVLLSQTPIVLDRGDDLKALPPRDQQLHQWAVSLHPVQATLATARTCLALIEGSVHARSLTIPVVVVSTGNRNLAYLKLQENLMALSDHSRHVIAERSGHSIELDQPEAIVQAIALLR
jgi:pimeloyl-ACP methyl ester carboxylesterase